MTSFDNFYQGYTDEVKRILNDIKPIEPKESDNYFYNQGVISAQIGITSRLEKLLKLFNELKEN